MNDELYELKDYLKRAKTGRDYINLLLDERDADKKLMNPIMNQNNMMYILGASEALYFAGELTQREYTLIMKYFGQ